MVTRFYLAHFPSVDTAGQSVSVAHRHRQQGAPLLLNHLRTQFGLKEQNIQITLLINFGFIVFLLKSPKIEKKKTQKRCHQVRTHVLPEQGHPTWLLQSDTLSPTHQTGSNKSKKTTQKKHEKQKIRNKSFAHLD